MDAEGFECKILYEFLSNDHLDYFLPYILMEMNHIRANMGGNCPNYTEVLERFFYHKFIPYSPFAESVDEMLVPSVLQQISKDNVSLYKDILWVHQDAQPLFW